MSKIHPLPPVGEIHYDDEGRPICHICGKAFNKLMTHVYYKHGMTALEYKKEFGLDLHNSIMSETSREKARQNNKRNWDKIKANLEKGAPFRYKEGHQGRTSDKVSPQTKKRLKSLKQLFKEKR